MPRTSDPAKYPALFHALIDKVIREGTVFIPHDHPTSFRGYLQSFFLSVEKAPGHPKSELVKNLMVRKVPGGIEVCDRDKSPAALAVGAILSPSDLPDTLAVEAENSFLADLRK